MEEKLCITCRADLGQCSGCGAGKSKWTAHPAYDIGKIYGKEAGLLAAWNAVKTSRGDSEAEAKIRALLEANQ